MRLIDVERLVDDYYKEKRDLHAVSWFEMTNYEIKAIPIEWIEKFMDRFRCDMVTGDEYALIHYMLCEWEIENEKDI